MLRSEFLALTLALAVRTDDVSDPAAGAGAQSLRVLLGTGAARRIDAQSFEFQGRSYRGTFSYTATGQVVNTVPLEQYLYSVVSREMPRSWPSAALQTQAIVARTYVLEHSRPTHDYDLVPSQADQMYTGMDAEHAETSAAVDATSGRVLRFARGFAQTVYSSCCGGHTEASSQAWGGAPLPYLCGIRCTFCKDSPWYEWTQSISVQKLRDALAEQFSQLGDLQDVTPDPPDPSGRAQFWTFEGSGGARRVKAADLRRAIGARTLPSLLVRRTQFARSAQPQPELIVQGAGLGHGVGLCQWGARGMAAAGARAADILSFYFPGTQIGSD